MLRIRIELCPDGDLDSAKTIATGIVGRVHEPEQPAGDAGYVVHLGPDDHGYMEVAATARVDHRPVDGPWRLVAAAIAAALAGDRAPDPPDAEAAFRAYRRATEGSLA
jgi:hypothetical protein